MREFVNGQSFHDNNGNLLHGRVIFYKKDTTEKANIFDVAGTVLSNPIYTNNVGQTSQQVFLDDIDYTIYFEKYIGSGNMETDTDDSHWAFQYSCINLYDTFNIEVDSKGLQIINTIADLRNTLPNTIATQNGNKILILAGYNTYGDKPLVEYIWNETSTDNDNGGSVIKVNNVSVGRWVFVPNQFTEVDVRHFGAFPVESVYNISDTQMYAIQRAYSYAADSNKILFFPSLEDSSGYYKTTVVGRAKFQKNTYVVVPSLARMTARLEGDESNFKIYQQDNYKGEVIIYGRYLQYACVVAAPGYEKDYSKITYNPSISIDINDNIQSVLSFNNIDVKFYPNTISTSGVSITLDNCNIISDGAISDDIKINFNNCTIKQQIFSNTYEGNNSDFTKCNSDIDNWTNIALYQDYLLKNGDTTVDFKGNTLSGVFEISKNMILYNVGNGTIKTLGNVTELKLMNSNVAISNTATNIKYILTNSNTIIAGNVKHLEAFGSYIVIQQSGNTIDILDLSNSTLQYTGNLTINQTCAVLDSYIDGTILYIDKVTVPNFTNSKINTVLDGYYISCVGCTLYKNVVTGAKNSQIDFYMKDNLFVSGAKHRIASTADQMNTKVIGKWIGNTGDNFISLNRTCLDPMEKNHSYVFEDNTGMASQTPSWSDTLHFIEEHTYYRTSFTTARTFTVDSDGAIQLDPYFYGCSNMTNTEDGSTDPNIYTTQFEMFTIGTDLTDVNISLVSNMKPTYIISSSGAIRDTRSFGINSIPAIDEVKLTAEGAGLPKQIMNISDYTWGLYNIPLSVYNHNLGNILGTKTDFGFQFNLSLKK